MGIADTSGKVSDEAIQPISMTQHHDKLETQGGFCRPKSTKLRDSFLHEKIADTGKSHVHPKAAR